MKPSGSRIRPCPGFQLQSDYLLVAQIDYGQGKLYPEPAATALPSALLAKIRENTQPVLIFSTLSRHPSITPLTERAHVAKTSRIIFGMQTYEKATEC